MYWSLSRWNCCENGWISWNGRSDTLVASGSVSSWGLTHFHYTWSKTIYRCQRVSLLGRSCPGIRKLSDSFSSLINWQIFSHWAFSMIVLHQDRPWPSRALQSFWSLPSWYWRPASNGWWAQVLDHVSSFEEFDQLWCHCFQNLASNCQDEANGKSHTLMMRLVDCLKFQCRSMGCRRGRLQR